MRRIIATLQFHIKGRMLSVAVFSYALAAGTSLYLVTARCGANCTACGYCGIMLGVLPLVVGLAAKDRLRRKLTAVFSFIKSRHRDKTYESSPN